MNHNSFDYTWTFLSGTKALEHLSSYLNHMRTNNKVIVVSATIDTVNKTVDYIVAYKPDSLDVAAEVESPFLHDALD